MAASIASASNQDHALQVIKKYRTYVGMIVEQNIRKLLILLYTNFCLK